MDFFIIGPLISNELCSFAGVDNEETKSLQLSHPPLTEGEGSPTTLIYTVYICVYVLSY